jgi:hypothetical protein
LNGRTKGDHKGRVTCKGVSAIDFFIITTSMFKVITHLNVLEFCHLYSDAHSPVEIIFEYGDVNMPKSTV